MPIKSNDSKSIPIETLVKSVEFSLRQMDLNKDGTVTFAEQEKFTLDLLKKSGLAMPAEQWAKFKLDFESKFPNGQNIATAVKDTREALENLDINPKNGMIDPSEIPKGGVLDIKSAGIIDLEGKGR